MAERGFVHEPIPAPNFVGQARLAGTELRLTPERSALYGYHVWLDPAPAELSADYAESATAAEARSAGDAEYAFALSNESEPLGCVLTAQARLYPEGTVDARYGAVFAAADAEVKRSLLENPAVAEASQGWVECVANNGLSYTSPSEAGTEFYEVPEVTDDERRVASIDAKCRADAQLYETLDRLETELTSTWVDENALVLEEVEQYVDECVERALDV